MAVLSRVADRGTVHLWLADLSCEPGPADQAMLSPDERLRWLRFRFARDRRRYLAAHVALRRLLADQVGCGPAELGFEIGAAGKPRLAGHGCEFSMSYAGDFALIGLAAHAEIGVDIEKVRTIPDYADLAALHFTRSERAELTDARCSVARERAFLRGWTRKEACVKALGTGLATAPSSFEAGLDSGGRVVDLLHARVELWSIDLGAGLVAACARRQ